MKNKILILFVFSLLSITFVKAQRFGYVDTKYIMNNMPQWNTAQNQLDKIVEGWEKEILTKQKEVEELSIDLKSQKALLTATKMQDRQNIINEKKAEVLELQKKYFSPEGKLISTQEKLVKPVQDMIWIAIQKVAKKRKLDFIFDKGDNLVMIFTNDKWDVSDDVIKVLGLKKIKK